MNTQSQIIALAKLDGFEAVNTTTGYCNTGYIKHEGNNFERLRELHCGPQVSDEREGLIWAQIPNYLSSYDAILPLIKKQRVDIQIKLIRELWLITIGKSISCGAEEASLFTLLATPQQLCEALLKACGKWEE